MVRNPIALAVALALAAPVMGFAQEAEVTEVVVTGSRIVQAPGMFTPHVDFLSASLMDSASIANRPLAASAAAASAPGRSESAAPGFVMHLAWK